MTVTSKHWTWWIIGVMAAFFILEIPAIKDGVPGGTLSEYVWGMAWWSRAVIIGGLIWLVAHFWWRV